MSQDSHQGGDLSDMAVTGTKMPNDAGKMNIMPSVTRPGEGFDSATSVTGVNVSQGTLACAADEGADIPRAYKRYWCYRGGRDGYRVSPPLTTIRIVVFLFITRIVFSTFHQTHLLLRFRGHRPQHHN
jgi:hypothetical protein